MFLNARFPSSFLAALFLLCACGADGNALTNTQPSPLTVPGIVGWTNIERRQNGDLPALRPDPALDAIALARARDMIEHRYFAHVSLDGNSAESVAKDQSYGYITIGENIALGDFLNDDDLVQQWMGSPAHRENILKSQYTHMGAAAVQATYEDREQWFAVQIFAAPLSLCPPTDAAIQRRIEAAKTDIANLERRADDESAAIRSMPASSARNERIEAYDALIIDIQSRQKTMNDDITAYNASVEKRNLCIKRHQ